MAWLQEYRASESFVVATVSVAIFTDTFIYAMIIPVMPVALVDRVGVSEQDVQLWVSILLAVYGGSVLLGSPFFGYFTDHCKLRQVPFVAGLVALASSTGLFALARSSLGIIVARALQGLSAAAVWVVGLSIIAENVPSDSVGKAMGYMTVALSWGSLLGPAIGGVMYDIVGYYGVFMAPICLLVADIVMRFAMRETKKFPKANDSPKSKSSLTSPASKCCNEIYDTFASRAESPTDSFPCPGPGDERAGLLVHAEPGVENGQKRERNASTSVFSLFYFPHFPLALAAILMISIVISSLDATLPLLVIEKFHWSSSGAGLIFAVPAIASFATVYIAESAGSIGPRALGAAAFMLVAISWFLMQLVKHNTADDKVLLGGLLAVLGTSISTIQMITMTEVSYAVEEHEAKLPGAFGDTLPIAQAYALFNIGLAGGQLIGPVIAGMIRIKAGWSALMDTLGVGCVLMSLLFLLFGKRPVGSMENRTDGGV